MLGGMNRPALWSIDMLQRLQNWLASPFSENMDAWGWALFVLFLMVIAFLWQQVLKTITEI